MVCSYSTATVLFGIIACSAYHTSAEDNGGTLGFVDLSQLYGEVKTVPTNSHGYLRLTDSFKIGDSSVYNIYVSTYGYISMEDSPTYSTLPNFPLADSDMVVAPFAAHISTSTTGSVLYTDFLQSYKYNSQLNDITDFIQSHTGDDLFYGSRMMVAEWNNVPLYSGSTSIINKFQVVLIDNTDGDSYAVFIYDCGTMMWGGGVIGWQASSSDYVVNALSGLSDNNNIACLYSTRQSAIVYRLSSCSYGEYPCDNRQCVWDYDKCDGVDDCGDNSDEQGCLNVGGVVGGSVAGLVIILFFSFTISLVISVRVRRRRRFARINACIIATTGPSVTVATISNVSSAQSAPLMANEQPPPTNYNYNYPASHHPPQQGPQVLVNPMGGHAPSHPPPPPYSPHPQAHSPYPTPSQAGPQPHY